MSLPIRPIIILLVFLCNACHTNVKPTENKEKMPVLSRIRFDKMVHDFGKVKAGKKVKYAYVYKNVGSVPLIITDVYTSCGCTVPNFSKKPLPPGEKASINVVFDSENDSGYQQKAITIVSNTEPSTTEVYLTGLVESHKYFN